MKKIGIIFFSFFIFCTFTSNLHAASLSFAPASGVQEVGKNFSVSFNVNTAGKVINASSGTVSFPANLLEVVSVSKTGSIFSLWVQEPAYSNTNGTINFEGVVLNPGFSGSSGKLVTVTFRPKAVGTAAVKFSSGAVLANDGLGTNLASTFNTANFSIGPASATPETPKPVPASLAPEITSSTHPDQNAWYNLTTAEFDWVLPSGALETRLLIGRNENNTPTVSYIPPISTKIIEDLGEGTYYFSVQHRTANGWSSVGRFKINIDKTNPLPFEIAVNQDGPIPKLSFETNDLDSGFSHYEIQVGDSEDLIRIEEQIVNEYELASNYRGQQDVVVTAFDLAGNFISAKVSVSFVAPNLVKPVITEYPKTGEQGELISLLGTGTPGSTVELTLSRKGSVVWIEEAVVDEDGIFNFVVASKLGLGFHTAVVSSMFEDTKLSSIPVSFKIEPAPLLAFAIAFVSYLGVAILVVVGLASFIKIVIYFTSDLRRTVTFLKHRGERGVSKKSKEVSSPLKVSKQTVNKKFF